MNRREFITLFVAVALTTPRPGRAQHAQMPRIGIIDDSPIWNALRQGLRDHGYVEGQNIALEYRYAGGLPDRLPWVAAELVRRPVDLIATFGKPATLAAMQATTTIPIVMIGIGDPVGAGLVSNLVRPGGNVTGNTILGPELAGKRLQLLKEMLPSLSRIAFLWNPDNRSHAAQLAELRTAVESMGLKLLPVAARSSTELPLALTAMMNERPDAFVMTNDPLHQLSIMMIIDFLANNRLPGMFPTREIVMAGGLVSYGASLADLFRRGAGYAHKILQGASPACRLSSQPNLNLSSTSGPQIQLVSMPPSFQVRADELIE